MSDYGWHLASKRGIMTLSNNPINDEPRAADNSRGTASAYKGER